MLSTVVAWLFGTHMGRGVLLGGSLAIGAGLSWWGFSDHYYEKGKTDCQLARAVGTNAANVAQGEQNAANNQVSSMIGQEAAKAGAAAVEAAQNATNSGKEKVDVVYRDAPATAPVALGSCVHPVDVRVQDEFEKARAAAVEARAR